MNLLNMLRYDSKKLVSGLVILLLVLLSSAGTPKIPPFLIRLLNNSVFKILYMTILLIVFQYKPYSAFLLALLFLLVLQTINNYQTYIDTTKDKLNMHNLSKGLINSAGNSVSSIVDDTRSILSSVSNSIVDFSNSKPNEHFEENFNDGFEPEIFENTVDQYTGLKFSDENSLGVINVENPPFMKDSYPEPLDQNNGLPEAHDKMPEYLENNLLSNFPILNPNIESYEYNNNTSLDKKHNNVNKNHYKKTY